MNLRPDDTFLVSYPKSGNTWVRFMLSNLIARPPKSFEDANNLVPDLHNAATPEVLPKVPPPRILKSHFPYQSDYRRVIYLVRDPRSVCVSQFYFKKRKGELSPEFEFEAFFDAFLEGFDDGFGDWGSHVSGWLGSGNHKPDLLVVRFEDLKRDTATQLSRMCDFAGLVCDHSDLKKAIENSTMRKMRQIEIETGLGSKMNGKGDLSIPFVRRGKTSEWQEYFSDDMDALIKSQFQAAMDLGGYA